VARLSYGVLSLCGVLLLCVGCRGALSPQPTQTAAAPQLTTAEPLWQHLTLRRQTFRTLKGLAQAQFYAPTQNLAVDSVAVVWQHFAALRLEGLGSLGQPLFLLITDGQQFSYYTPQEARLVSGTASASNMERLFGLTLAPNALQYMLIGDIPLDPVPSGGTLGYLPKPDLYLWEGQAPQQSGRYRVWFAAAHRQPVRFEVEDILGRLVLRVQYENFRQVQDFTMPYHITVDQPLAEQRVVWRYSDVRINAEVLPALFHMRVPAGVERVELQ
jgi:hypothetical protein